MGEVPESKETVLAARRDVDDSLMELSRDARNALQGTFGAIDLMQNTSLTAEQREYLDFASSAAENLMDAVVRAETELAQLADIASSRGSDSVERILAVARESLGMEVAFTSEFTGGEQVYRSVQGDGDSFGFREGGTIPLEATFCQRVIAGRLPNVVPDAKNDERVSDLEVASSSDIGSYVGLPIELSDGHIYGTLCCMSHSPEPHLLERDVKFMTVLTRLVADQIERENL